MWYMSTGIYSSQIFSAQSELIRFSHWLTGREVGQGKGNLLFLHPACKRRTIDSCIQKGGSSFREWIKLIKESGQHLQRCTAQPAHWCLTPILGCPMLVNRLQFIPDYSRILTKTFVINFNLDLRSALTKCSIISLLLRYL